MTREDVDTVIADELQRAASDWPAGISLGVESHSINVEPHTMKVEAAGFTRTLPLSMAWTKDELRDRLRRALRRLLLASRQAARCAGGGW